MKKKITFFIIILTAIIVNAIPIPNLISPANNATNIPLTNSFFWTQVGAINISYWFRMSTDSTFSTTPYFISIGEIPNRSTPFYTASGLTKNTKYYWRVMAYTDTGFVGFPPLKQQSGWSKTYSFTTVIASTDILHIPFNLKKELIRKPTVAYNILGKTVSVNHHGLTITNGIPTVNLKAIHSH